MGGRSGQVRHGQLQPRPQVTGRGGDGAGSGQVRSSQVSSSRARRSLGGGDGAGSGQVREGQLQPRPQVTGRGDGEVGQVRSAHWRVGLLVIDRSGYTVTTKKARQVRPLQNVENQAHAPQLSIPTRNSSAKEEQIGTLKP